MPQLTKDKIVEDWNAKQPNFVNLNARAQEFYYWVNYSRSNSQRFFDSVVTLFTEVYPQLKGENYESLRKDLTEAKTLPLLTLNPKLIKMAKGHAEDIVTHQSNPSHNSTNGDSFSDRFKHQNLKDCGGENLSYGAGEPVFLLVLLYLDLNVPNLGHRKALLNSNYVETGIAAATFDDGTVFIVQDFACRQN